MTKKKDMVKINSINMILVHMIGKYIFGNNKNFKNYNQQFEGDEKLHKKN